MSDQGLVIVGGSYAAVQMAASARELGYAEPIRIISNEPAPPYHRPPLSKGYLLGKVAESTLAIRAPKFFDDNHIDLALDTHVVSIDRTSRRIETADGQRIGFECLGLALGARPRSIAIPGIELEGVFFLRSVSDARPLRAAIDDAQSVIVVGAGFIGLEVASVLASQGKFVTILEAGQRILARSAAPPLASYVTAMHEAQGVRFLMNRTLIEIVGCDGRVSAVRDSEAHLHRADMVVVGVGVQPNIELARDCGLACSQGIEVDAYACTSDPAIWSAGDCTVQRLSGCQDRVRLESVQNALDQAKVAAAAISGAPRAYDVVPWFWSDQYSSKLQMAGLARSYDSHVTRGSIEAGKFSIFYFAGDNLCAVDSVNRPAEHMAARKLLKARAKVRAVDVRDMSFDLNSALVR